MTDFTAIFKEVENKINEREALYYGTWQKVPIQDLISVVRLKIYRAEALLTSSDKEKLLDDLIDAIAYLVFCILRVRGGSE